MNKQDLAEYKRCKQGQTRLQRLFKDPAQAEQALELFRAQHAAFHSAAVADPPGWSFEDAVLAGMPQAHWGIIPPGQEHTIAWLLWHMARCEDATMNLLVAGSDQVLDEGWLSQLGVSITDTGNCMTREEILIFSQCVNPQALLAYRLAVGQRTQHIAADLQPGDLHLKVDLRRMERIWGEGVVLEGSRGIADYWSRRDVAGLLFMPAGRHLLTHLDEIGEVRKALGV